MSCYIRHKISTGRPVGRRLHPPGSALCIYRLGTARHCEHADRRSWPAWRCRSLTVNASGSIGIMVCKRWGRTCRTRSGCQAGKTSVQRPLAADPQPSEDGAWRSRGRSAHAAHAVPPLTTRARATLRHPARFCDLPRSAPSSGLPYAASSRLSFCQRQAKKSQMLRKANALTGFYSLQFRKASETLLCDVHVTLHEFADMLANPNTH